MNKFQLLFAILLVSVPIFLVHAPALGFRCGTELIQTGDRAQEVLQKCGEPDTVEIWYEKWPTGYHRYYGSRPRHQDYGYGWVKAELWTYKGPTMFVRYLRFQNGVLVEITRGDKKYGRENKKLSL